MSLHVEQMQLTDQEVRILHAALKRQFRVRAADYKRSTSREDDYHAGLNKQELQVLQALMRRFAMSPVPGIPKEA